MKVFFVFICSIFSLVVFAQDRREYKTNFQISSPKIDGILDEDVWKAIPVTANFTQTIPKPDEPSVYQSEVKLFYTTNSIFVAAKLYQPKAIQLKQMTARDELNRCNADVFSVFLDTYDDHQNGFAFRVSAAGVQQDERLSNGLSSGDITWDAVWNSRVSSTDDYWIVEMEIPFSAIRFSKNDQQKWGLNFLRLVRKINENSYWNPINVNQQGFLKQTGLLTGLDNLKPPTRLFLYPYISGGYYEKPENNTVNKGFLRSGGMDIKYGINESFTLDLTLIPDFSQVVSDNLIRNLSPFEQQLTENRPFFTEGTELFNKAAIFYSRRVGSRPSGYYSIQNKYSDTSSYSIEKNPNNTSLINAIKFSGRTKNNIGIGIFNSVGSPIYAKVNDKTRNENLKIQTEPIANYNVVVIDKPLKGQSFINFTNTNVLKNGFSRDANVSSLRWVQFSKKEDYSFSITSRLSVQNEDQYKVGSSWNGEFNKVAGKFQFNSGFNLLFPKYDHNDMGILFDYNHASQYLLLSYNENKPKLNFLQSYRISLENRVFENLQPFEFKAYQMNASYFWLFKNFWDITYEIETKPITPTDYYQLRNFNKKLKQFPYFFQSLNGSSDSRKKLFWNFYFGYGFSSNKTNNYCYVENGLRYLIKNKFELSVSGNMTRDNSNIGYALDDANLNEPVAGLRNVREYSGLLSVKYNVSPTMNFTARFRHYTNFISYRSFHLVDNNGNWKNSPYPFQNGMNENYNLQNVDVFFNWMFKPGSRFVLSYKQWLNDSYIINSKMDNVYAQNVYEIIKKPKAFEVAARFIYFLDWNEMKGKH